MRRLPYFSIEYEAIVTDIKTGRVTFRKKGKCHSFVKAFIQLLQMHWFLNSATITDTGNTSRALTPGGSYGVETWMKVNAGVGIDTWGSVVGTGTNAVTINDYALQTKVLHGSTAGKLQYGGVTFGAPATDASNTTFIVTRVFTNASGGTIAVSEIGLICNQGSYYFLLIRDVLGSAVSIPNGQALTLNYTLKTTI